MDWSSMPVKTEIAEGIIVFMSNLWDTNRVISSLRDVQYASLRPVVADIFTIFMAPTYGIKSLTCGMIYNTRLYLTK